MPHEITRKNFFDASGKPAWHNLSVFEKLGVEREERDYTAEEVYGLFGRPQYSLSPLYYRDKDGVEVRLDDQAIIRHPVEDDPHYRTIGRASDRYELIGGTVAADLWDTHVGLPVETMMLLRNDGVLCITATLPKYDVKGEDIANYLIFTNGMDGKTASRADVSGVRVVCANTLRMAQSRTVHHTTGSIDRLTNWMSDIASRALFQMDVMKETYTILAETPFNEEQIRWIAGTVYRDPKEPDKNFAYKHGYENQVIWYERTKELAEERRTDLVKLFSNNTAIGFGEDQSETQGTAWHALNCVTQVLTHGRTSNFRARSESLLIGERAGMIEKVTDMILAVVPEAKASANRVYVPQEAVLNI